MISSERIRESAGSDDVGKELSMLVYFAPGKLQQREEVEHVQEKKGLLEGCSCIDCLFVVVQQLLLTLVVWRAPSTCCPSGREQGSTAISSR